MKIAIVHDELIRRGGAEQVTLCFHHAFPQAPIYTMVYRPELTYPEFKQCRIVTSWFQKIAVNERIMKKLFFPFGMMAMKQLDVTAYDIVLISSTYGAKYVKVKKNALVINYCHSPFRLAWYPESYIEYTEGTGLKKWLLNKVIGILRKVDYAAALRTDYFIANAREMAEKIRSVYKPGAEVAIINPPVSCKDFYVSETIDNYYLVVCRLEHYKRVDIVIEAFNALKLPLVIVGKGTQEERLKRLAGKTITFKSGVSREELATLYSKCIAFIFPQIEDYGITPLEANASGRPVIAYGKGGVLETMRPWKAANEKFTALFFDRQTPEALIQAINLLNNLAPDSGFIRDHALRFDTPAFIQKIQKFVISKHQENRLKHS